jgi:hypothetical protein
MDPPRNPPCEDCKPALLPENQETVDVYLISRGQVVTAGMGSIVDISFPALKVAMDMLGVKDQRGCFNKVRHLFHEFKPKEEKP